jgi:hypothetical protein
MMQIGTGPEDAAARFASALVTIPWTPSPTTEEGESTDNAATTLSESGRFS